MSTPGEVSALRLPPGCEISASWTVPSHMDILVMYPPAVKLLVGPENWRLLVVDRHLPSIQESKALLYPGLPS